MSDEQDRADVARVLAGDPEAFAGIVRRWQGPLVTLAYRFCRDHYGAEEMAQTAFVTAFQALRQWRGESVFSGWLFAVATNVYRSALRRRRLLMRERDSARLAAYDRGDTDEGHPTDRDGVADRDSIVRRAVLTLPRKYRDALTLFYFHRMDLQETARSLGLRVGTLKAQLHRGRELLRRRLAAELASAGRSEGD